MHQHKEWNTTTAICYNLFVKNTWYCDTETGIIDSVIAKLLTLPADITYDIIEKSYLALIHYELISQVSS